MTHFFDISQQTDNFTFEWNESYGECEDCNRITAEWQLNQCQFGFCGRFFCSDCGYRCERCKDSNPRSVQLCDSHARIAYPRCTRCESRFCDDCTNVVVKKCLSCLDNICSLCINKEEQHFSNTCGNCSNKTMRPLQDMCRTSIRRAIRASLATPQEELHPKQIDMNIKHLPIPSVVKSFMRFE